MLDAELESRNIPPDVNYWMRIHYHCICSRIYITSHIITRSNNAVRKDNVPNVDT